MMDPITNTSELDVLFDLFNEDFSDDMDDSHDSLNGESDNTDDTSSESSGSSGHSSSTCTSHSPPFQQICTHYAAPPPAVVFASNPLSSFTSETTHSSNKRTRTEDKLLRNRESANKSRLKRKNEKSQLEATVTSLTEQVRTLEMQNTALLTDNTTLSQHNFFLQGLLKKQQLEHEAAAPFPSHKTTEARVSSQSQMSALSGISVLCVVFSVSFFNEWLPSSLSSAEDSSWGMTGSSAGRVLPSVDDDDYSYSSSSVLSHPSSHPRVVALHYLLILSSMFLYYFYIQYDQAVQKKSTRLLPS